MGITDLIFLFLFLPALLFVYYIARDSVRNYILLLASLLFYACGSMEYFFLLIVSLIINISLGICIGKFKGMGRKGAFRLFLTAGIVYDLSILFFYKYFDFVSSNLCALLEKEYTPRNLALPLGLSFFTFKAISYLADVYQGRVKAERNPLYAALYLSFFPQIQSGPLSRYSDMDFAHTGTWKENAVVFSEGVYRFMIGFCKKILLANVLANITTEAFSASPDHMSMAFAWMGSVCYTMQLFFDFAGYSDMAIGLTKMFGFDCPENFNYPYMTASISEFWRRWHMTLGAWFRDYIYIPLGGSRVNRKWRLYLNLLAVWLATGIWHGASWNFVAWGLGYFVLIAFEKTTGWPEKFQNSLTKIIYRIFALLFINFQWVIFRANGLRAGLLYIKNMMDCQGADLANKRVLFLLKDNWAFLLAAVVFCFPVIPALQKLAQKRRGTAVLWEATVAVVSMALFVWALSFVTAGQNNPFAYANF